MKQSVEPEPASLIGREDDLARLMDLLRHDRLVSLTGPGGAGKTHLASGLLASWRLTGAEGWFVDCSARTDPMTIASEILAAMGAEGGAEDAVDAVTTGIGASRSLVVLDNLEQAQNPDAIVTPLLAGAQRVRLVTTTRVPIGVRGAVEWPVAPLGLPDGDDPASVVASPAGALFLARAREVGRLVALGADSSEEVARLLRRLDGLPLAIELAAARTRVLSCREILARLDARGVAGIDAAPSAPRRSLAAILDWTLGLLGPGQQAVLDAISPCAAFDLELASDLAGADALDGLESLLSLGIVARTGEIEGVSRFRLLETVRHEVQARQAAETQTALAERHARLWFERAGRLEPGGSGTTVDWLDAWADDLRLALAHLAPTKPGKALVLWTRLFPLWVSRHRQREGLGWFETIEARTSESSAALSQALSRFVALRFQVVGEVAARADNARAMAIAREVDDRRSLVEALAGVVQIELVSGDIEAVMAAAAEATALAATLGEPHTTTIATQAQAFAVTAAHGAASQAARDVFAELVVAAIATGDRSLELAARGNLAFIHLYRAEYAAAVVVANQAVELARRIDSALLGWCLPALAIGLAEIGQADRARAALIEAAERVVILDAPGRVVDVLVATVAVAHASGQPRLAAMAAGVVRAIGAADAVRLPRDDIALLERFMTAVGRDARPIELDLAGRDGEASNPTTFLAALPERLATIGDGSRTDLPAGHLHLTKREVEILALVGAGRSDPEIADSLFISPKTASVHVANIKAKLGLDSRLAIALRARELGLGGPGE